jgi:hypothetical protein
MANTFVKLATLSAGSGGVSSFDFTSIPSTYTDLVLFLSVRASADNTNAYITLNNDSTASYNWRNIQNGNGTISADPGSGQTKIIFGAGANAGVSYTAGVFSNSHLYFPNYTSSNLKAIQLEGVTENNGTSVTQNIMAGNWTGTAAVNRITIAPPSATFVQYSTATLYGIKKD